MKLKLFWQLADPAAGPKGQDWPHQEHVQGGPSCRCPAKNPPRSFFITFPFLSRLQTVFFYITAFLILPSLSYLYQFSTDLLYDSSFHPFPLFFFIPQSTFLSRLNTFFYITAVLILSPCFLSRLCLFFILPPSFFSFRLSNFSVCLCFIIPFHLYSSSQLPFFISSPCFFCRDNTFFLTCLNIFFILFRHIQ